ncbi:MAG: haloacid dehalogenase-like hydrolase [Adlercreutzia equolifaciens]
MTNLTAQLEDERVIMPQASTYVRIPDDAAFRGETGPLPAGVRRVTPDALGAVRLMDGPIARNAEGKVQVAAFDFDGTCIQGNSPVMLVRYLVRRRMLSPSVVARILSWAFAYKTRLPQNEAWVRGLVFRAFAGRPVAEVNGFLRDFYDQVIDRRFRADAEAEMAAPRGGGGTPWCACRPPSSPSSPRPWSAALIQLRHRHAHEGRLPGQLHRRGGGRAHRGPREGGGAPSLVRRAVRRGWLGARLACGDHHSDRAVLAAAKSAYAVTPDRPLAHGQRPGLRYLGMVGRARIVAKRRWQRTRGGSGGGAR